MARYGLSEPIDYRKTTPRSFGEHWLGGLVESLGVGKVDIIGSSMGGYFALVLALAAPDTVRRIVTVGSHPGYSRATPAIIRMLAAPGIGALLLRQRPKDAEANRREVFSHLSASPEKIPVDMLENDLAAGALPNTARVSGDFVRTLANPLSGLRSNLLIRDEIQRLAVPTLFLWGTKDNFMTPETVRPVLDRAQNVQLTALDGAGHVLTLEQPTAVIEAANAFLAMDDP